MALTEEYLAQMKERLLEIKIESETMFKTVPELIEMQELLLEELSEMHDALSEVYGYAVTYEKDPKDMSSRLEKIHKVTAKALDLQSYKDF